MPIKLLAILQGELTKKEAKHIVWTIRKFTKKFDINSEIITDYIEELADILPNNYQEFTTLYQVFKALMYSKKTGSDWLESQDNQKLITDLLDFVESQTEYEVVAKSESVINTQDSELVQPVQEVVKSNEQITTSDNSLQTPESREQLLCFIRDILRFHRIRENGDNSSLDKLIPILKLDFENLTNKSATKTGLLVITQANVEKY